MYVCVCEIGKSCPAHAGRTAEGEAQAHSSCEQPRPPYYTTSTCDCDGDESRQSRASHLCDPAQRGAVDVEHVQVVEGDRLHGHVHVHAGRHMWMHIRMSTCR